MRINWQKKYYEAEGLLKIQRDGNALLMQERDSWKNRFELFANDPHLCPKSKWYSETQFTNIGTIVGISIVALFVAIWGWKIGDLTVTEIPHETIRYVTKHDPVLVTKLLTCIEHNDAAIEAWEQDERELRKLRKEK